MTEPSLDELEQEGGDSILLPQNIMFTTLIKLGLAKPGLSAVLTACVVFMSLAFVPLIIICAIDGTAVPGNVKLPLVMDCTTMTRFLLVGPCLLLSEVITKPWLIKITNNFVTEGLIPKEHLPAYKNLVKNVFKLRESPKVEIALLVLAVVFSIAFSEMAVLSNLQPSSWYIDSGSAGPHLSRAGHWYTFFGQPIFRFLILDWVFEYLLWSYFLLRVALLSPRIQALHPDGAGGLLFVGAGQTQFCLPAFALSAAVCSVVADTIAATGANIKSFTNLGAAWLVFILVLFQGPLLVFTPVLIRKKRDAFFMYSNLSRYACDAFSQKWIPPQAQRGAEFLASSDASSIADYTSDFKTVASMRTFLFGKQSVVSFLVAGALPALPLVASVMPLNELLQKILQALT
ncbi:MAG: hypothetical protein K2W95_34240 [Candidatus Obscuribacterales bacterium]|nr:hypothetical protein [Candidatus Obscuribacterales bacterium]